MTEKTNMPKKGTAGVSFRYNMELLDMLKEKSRKTGISLSRIIVFALEKMFQFKSKPITEKLLQIVDGVPSSDLDDELSGTPCRIKKPDIVEPEKTDPGPAKWTEEYLSNWSSDPEPVKKPKDQTYLL